ncbi:MAG: hypothetical protein DME99_12020 [Verrucomicrobia bacterium]|nr:MAG: hypothetical protein DME99_12020 [Verrucomicrobiota bacterium]
MYVLPTSEEQDDAFIAAFKRTASSGPSRVGNDCADAVAAGLRAAGLLNPNAAQTFPSMINDYMQMRAIEGDVSAIVLVPQGGAGNWGIVTTLLGSFNP